MVARYKHAAVVVRPDGNSLKTTLSRPEVQRDAMWRHVPKKPFPYATISSFSCSLAAETPGFTDTTFLMPRDGFHMANKDE